MADQPPSATPAPQGHQTYTLDGYIKRDVLEQSEQGFLRHWMLTNQKDIYRAYTLPQWRRMYADACEHT